MTGQDLQYQVQTTLHENQRMPTTVMQQLNAPAGRVWRLIIDTHTWPAWGPTVTNVDCRQRFIHAGTRGRVRTPLGIWLPFRVEAFEPECYWDWRVGGVTATGHRVEPAGPMQCRLIFTVPMWAAPYRRVCRAALGRIEHLLAETGAQYPA